MNAKKIFIVGFSLVVAMHLYPAAFAEEAKKEEAKKEPVVTIVDKEVQGEVSFIMKKSISIVYERNVEKGEESEILLPIDFKNLKMEHKKSYADINPGDIVRVQYEEEKYDYGDRQETKLKAKVITFLKPGDAKSPYKGLGASEKESLPLKGVKSDEK